MTPSIPCGYPPPHDPSKVAVFTVSDDWCCDDLLDCYGSLDEVLEVIKGLVREDVPDYDDLTAEAVARQILDVRLQDGIYRHQVPFYSSGVKRELKQKGIHEGRRTTGIAAALLGSDQRSAAHSQHSRRGRRHRRRCRT